MDWNSPRRITVTLPAQRDLMLPVRMTASGVLARSGITVDRLDEIKMAVEECCSLLLPADDPSARLELTFLPGEGEFGFRCSRACRSGQCIPPEEREVAEAILRSLADECEIDLDPEGVIRSVSITARSDH